MRLIFSTLTKIALLSPLLAAVLLVGKLNAAQALPFSRPLTLEWKYSSGMLTTLQPACGAEAVYAPLSDGTLIALSARDGQLAWKADAGGYFAIRPTFDDQTVYVITQALKLDDFVTLSGAPPLIRALSRASGITLWTHKLPEPPLAAAASEHMLFTALANGEIYALDKYTGLVRWSVKLPSPISTSIEVVGTKLYFGSLDGDLFALQQETGGILRRYRTRQKMSRSIVVRDGEVYAGSADGYLSAFQQADGKLLRLWRKRAGTRVQALAYAGGGLLVTTEDNFVTFFAAQTGKKLWKRLLPARLAVPPVVAADAALFAPLGEETCVVLSLRDGKQVNAIALGSDNPVVAAPTSCGSHLLVPTRAGLLSFKPSE